MAAKTFLNTALTIFAILFLPDHLTFAAPPRYEIIDLGTLGGEVSSAAFISNNGGIVGCSENSLFRDRAVFFDPTVKSNIIDLGTLGGNGSIASSMNTNRQIVGLALDSKERYRATLFDATGNGNNTDLGTLGGGSSSAVSVNEIGLIVGYARNDSDDWRAVIFDPTGTGDNIDLGTLGGDSSSAYSINNNLQIVGEAETELGTYHKATLFDQTGRGNNTDLDPFHSVPSCAKSINDNGQIVGFLYNYPADTHPILFDSTGSGNNIDLGTLGGSWGLALSINNRGQIVGKAEDNLGRCRATMFDPSGAGNNIDLNTLIYGNSGWILKEARSINDAGWIVGQGLNPDGKEHAFLMTPVPPKIIYVDDDAAGANDGSSWADAFNYLQDALAIAWSGDEIRVAQGVYTPDSNSADPNGSGDRTATFQLINGVTVKGGYAGFGTPDPDDRRISLYETILTGDLNGDDVEVDNPADLIDEPTRAENSCHIVTGGGTDETAILNGFTVTGGSATDPVNKIGENYWGAGMSNHYGSPTVKNCNFIANLARNGGGGMDNFHSSPSVSNCTFRANATRGGASGMQNRDESSPMVTGCVFSKNYSINHGAAMRNDSGSSPALVNCLFNDNVGRLGAAMCISSYFGQSDPILINCTFSANAAVLYGGGIYISGGSNPTLVNCILWDNSDGTGSVESAQIYVDSGDPVINYTCVQSCTGSLGGTGNIGNDPLFADPANADYHLQPGSPCINAGDPDYIAEPNETDLDGRPRIIFGRIDMGAYETPILADVRILPQTINLASKGNWITCYIRLPEEYNVADIEPNSIFLEDEIKFVQFSVDEQQQVATARFNRQDVQTILDIGEIELTITGRLTDGTVFEATDTIKVIDKEAKK